MAQTTNYNLPYPSDYTEVADVPEAIKDLAEATDTALTGKVDTEAGKGLSSNDFTTAYKEKLDGIETGAEVNVIEEIQLDGTALPVSSGAVNIEIDTSALQTKANLVTSLSSSSTDTQYPSAKCVYDLIGDLETILQTLDVGRRCVNE